MGSDESLCTGQVYVVGEVGIIEELELKGIQHLEQSTRRTWSVLRGCYTVPKRPFEGCV